MAEPKNEKVGVEYYTSTKETTSTGKLSKQGKAAEKQLLGKMKKSKGKKTAQK